MQGCNGGIVMPLMQPLLLLQAMDVIGGEVEYESRRLGRAWLFGCLWMLLDACIAQ